MDIIEIDSHNVHMDTKLDSDNVHVGIRLTATLFPSTDILYTSNMEDLHTELTVLQSQPSKSNGAAVCLFVCLLKVTSWLFTNSNLTHVTKSI